MIADYFRLAFKNIKKRKLRSWLTMIGIIIAVATIFTLISISIGLQGAVEEQFRQFGTDKFFIQPSGQLAGPGTGGAVQFTIEDVETIEKVSGVHDVSYWTAGNAEIEFSGEKRFVFVIGIPLEASDVFIETGFYKPDEGRLLKKGDFGEIMIGSQYKNNNFFKKPVKAGDKIKIQGKDFKVSSILETLGNPQDDRTILMPYKDFKEIFPETGERVDQIIAQIEPGQNVNEVAKRTEKKLQNFRKVNVKTQDFSILTPEEILESFGTILNILTGFLIGVAAISLLVGGIGIANTMYTSVLERTNEIGLMKAIGAKNSDITLIFLIESGLLGFVGGIIGVLFGISISKGIEFIAVNQLGTTLLQAGTPFYLIFGSLAFAFLTGAISGTLPALQAARIKPVDALRYE